MFSPDAFELNDFQKFELEKIRRQLSEMRTDVFNIPEIPRSQKEQMQLECFNALETAHVNMTQLIFQYQQVIKELSHKAAGNEMQALKRES